MHITNDININNEESASAEWQIFQHDGQIRFRIVAIIDAESITLNNHLIKNVKCQQYKPETVFSFCKCICKRRAYKFNDGRSLVDPYLCDGSTLNLFIN